MSLYLISDTHFDHSNIIEYCNRPFSSGEDMDKAMKGAWNSRVQEDDRVFFGGDIAMARASIAIKYANALNGDLVFIDGNHDDITQSEAPFPLLNNMTFSYDYNGETYDFFYVHWPAGTEHHKTGEPNYPPESEPPEWFDGWVLHGHVHNNDIEKFPFVNPEQKYVNLSVEVIGYTPIEIEELIQILNNGERYDTINDVPEDDTPPVVMDATVQDN